MTLFIDVQGVPNAILDLVKARILANRKRNKERASAATAVKPEQPARRRYYSPVAPDRRPEPAGIPLGGPGWLLVPSDNELNVKVRATPAFLFWRDNTTQPMQVDLTGGPDGTPCLRAPFIPSNTEGNAAAWLKTFRDTPKEPKSKSFTFEVMAKYGIGNAANADSRAFMAYTLYGGAEIEVRWDDTIYVDQGNLVQTLAYMSYGSPAIVDGNYYWARPAFACSARKVNERSAVVPQIGNPTVYHHFAVVQTPGASDTVRNIAFYADGVRFWQEFNIPQPVWPKWGSPYVPSGDLSLDLANEFVAIDNLVGDANANRVHGIRYTERALYTGATYTPPTSITRLA